MAGKVEAQGAGITDFINFINLLGGQKQGTQTTGDTEALRALLAQLQGTDYTAMMQGLMQQVQGSLPGLTSRMSNAVGARSGNNGAVQAQLSKVLQDAMLRGSEMVANAQLKNQGLQAQIGSDIGRLTMRQTQKSGTNLDQAAKVGAGLKVAGDIYNSDMFKTGVGKAKDLFGGMFDSGGAEAVTGADPLVGLSSGFSTFSEPITSAATQNYDAAVNGLSTAWDAVSNWWDSVDFGSWGFSEGGLVPSVQGFAEGGVVTARTAGGRTSSAPQYTPQAPTPAQAVNVAGPVPASADQMIADLILQGLNGAMSNPGSSDPSGARKPNNPVGWVDEGNGSPIAGELGGALAKQAIPTLLGGMMNPMAMLRPISSAVNKGIGIDNALSESPDPLLSMLIAAPGKGVITPAQASNAGSDVLAAAANAASTATGADPLQTLFNLTNSFGTGTSSSGSSGVSSNNGGDNTSAGFGGASGAGGDSAGAGYSKGGGVKPSHNMQGHRPPSRTDTVPAMLTPGEFVLSKELTDAIGVDLLQNLQDTMNRIGK